MRRRRPSKRKAPRWLATTWTPKTASSKICSPVSLAAAMWNKRLSKLTGTRRGPSLRPARTGRTKRPRKLSTTGSARTTPSNRSNANSTPTFLSRPTTTSTCPSRKPHPKRFSVKTRWAPKKHTERSRATCSCKRQASRAKMKLRARRRRTLCAKANRQATWSRGT